MMLGYEKFEGFYNDKDKKNSVAKFKYIKYC